MFCTGGDVLGADQVWSFTVNVHTQWRLTLTLLYNIPEAQWQAEIKYFFVFFALEHYRRIRGGFPETCCYLISSLREMSIWPTRTSRPIACAMLNQSALPEDKTIA